MKRKIIKQASQAYTITLPIGWVRKNNLDEKSEVDVEESEKSLVINSNKAVVGEKVVLDMRNLHLNNVFRHINALYARGVDEIELIYGRDISHDLLSFLNQTMGYALISQSSGKFIIKDISGGNYQNLDEIFKRVFQMIISFYESAIKDIFGNEKETLKSLDSRDSEVNKFCLYLQRAINKMSYPDVVKGRALFTYSFSLEKISDEIHRLWRANIKHEIKKTEALKELAELSCEGLGKSFDLYYGFNSKKVEEIYYLRQKVREKSLSLKVEGHTIRFVRHIVKIIEDAHDLSHLAIMMRL